MPLYTTNFPSITVQSTGALGWSDVVLARDAANTLALRNGTNGQTLNIYNTYTDASNYERLFIGYSGNVAFIQSGNAGTGTNRALAIGTAGGGSFVLQTANTSRWQIDSSGHFTAVTDNTYDIGASGATRPRIIYVGTAIVTPAAGYVKTTPTTVGSLPAAATAGAGARAFVSDASAPTFGATVASGGAVNVPVYSDGTNWKVG